MISVVSATFLEIFPAVSLYLGAVLEISAVSATFFRNFFSFWARLGCCFRSFMDYSYPRPACYQPMAIVHYANLVWGILCYRIKMMVHTGFAERALKETIYISKESHERAKAQRFTGTWQFKFP